MEDFKERRQCKRYRSKEDVGAYVAIRPTFRNVGAVKDVSLGGLGFDYIVTGDKKPLSDEDSLVDLDLFISNNGFYLPRLRCRLAYDKAAERQPSFAIDMQYRRCGIEFDQPTAGQREQLEFFLENYTAGET